MLELNKVYNMDCLEGLKQLDDNSIDLIATDPPYGMTNLHPLELIENEEKKSRGFMGKEWDNLPPTKIWAECLRVLKPGAFAFIMCAPRQDLQLVMYYRLSKAGFEINFTPLYWAYASGFPKATNIGKMVDKKMGTYKEGKPTKNARFSERETEQGSYSHSKITREFEACSDEAKALDGSYAGFQPKPAVEVILIAMKPLSEKTYVDQALKNGKGVTWLDDCRIPYESEDDKEGARFGNTDSNPESYGGYNAIGKNVLSSQSGRFPANLLVSDDVLNDGQEGRARGNINPTNRGGGLYGHNIISEKSGGYGDSGSFSRYFSLDSWAEKNVPNFGGEAPFSLKGAPCFPFLITPKASKGEKNEGCDEVGNELKKQKVYKMGSFGNQENFDCPDGAHRVGDKGSAIMKNHHPTVKPLQLMSYLVTLGSRQNDTVLDPFLGSGTTAIAARHLNRNFIGFEISEEYCKIAEARLKPYMEQQKLK
jgi:site-specific DNA-methyltransferase (adenine-specific)